MTVLVVNAPASVSSSGVASSCTVIGPALMRNAAKTDPASR